MSLTPISFLAIGLALLAGIIGQWAGEPWTHLWRYPAALTVCLWLGEGLIARSRVLSLDRRLVSRSALRSTLDAPPETTVPKLALGEPAWLVTRIANETARPLRLQTEPRYAGAIAADIRLTDWRVAPGEVHRARETVTPTALGRFGLGPLYVRIRGRWGLAWWTRAPVPGPEFTVVPRRLSHDQSGIATAARGNKPLQGIAASGLDLLTLRDYQPGDPPRAIDWKASAKAGKPIVRLYAEERRMDLVLVVDAGRNSRLQAGTLTRLHHSINVAARLAELAVAEGDRVALVSFAGESPVTVPLAGGTAGLRRVRHGLAQLRSSQKEYNPLAAVLYLRGILQLRSLVLFMTEIAEVEAAGQLAKAIRLLVPKHSPLVASILDESIEAMRHLEPRHWLDPYRSLAAMEYGRARDNGVLQLRRLGADVVVAPADRLDPAVLKRYQLLRERHRA